MEHLLIRDATQADMPALNLLRDAATVHEAKLKEAATGTVRFLLAALRGEIVGFASLFLSNPTVGPAKSHIPKLSDCLIAPAVRSQGIGRTLVRAREDIARKAGHGRLFTSVDPIGNPWWFDFFRRRGYIALQSEPYQKREPRHSSDGVREVSVWRQDLVVDLNCNDASNPANQPVEPTSRSAPHCDSRLT